MKKIGIFILLLFFWNGEGLKADIVARDSVITDMKTVINELLADTVDMAAVRQDTVAYIPQDSLSVLRDSISVEADSLLLEIDRAAIHFEDSIRHLKDSLMKAERAKKRIVPQEHPEVTAIFYDTCPGAQAGLAALNELGRRCPDEISVIATSCFCGSENYTIPALTTVSYPARVLMDRAFEIILMPEKKFPERSLTPPELHRRASVRNLML